MQMQMQMQMQMKQGVEMAGAPMHLLPRKHPGWNRLPALACCRKRLPTGCSRPSMPRTRTGEGPRLPQPPDLVHRQRRPLDHQASRLSDATPGEHDALLGALNPPVDSTAAPALLHPFLPQGYPRQPGAVLLHPRAPGRVNLPPRGLRREARPHRSAWPSPWWPQTPRIRVLDQQAPTLRRPRAQG